MKKLLYIFFGLFLIITFFTSYKIISGNYDKQNLFIIKIKEIIPTQIKNKLRRHIDETRVSLNEDKIKEKQEAKKKQGLEQLFEGIEDILFKHKVQENVILNACETEKIQWLYENQLVKSSELSEDNIKLELIWDDDEQQRFRKNFVETVL